MKISIAMCTYNGSKYIEEMLESFLNQTRQADEVVIHDDCSNDNTIILIQEFIARNGLASKGWKVCVNKKNLGFKRNFYETVREVSGDIVFLADQDDKWAVTKLEEIEYIMKNENVLAVNTAYCVIDAEGNIQKKIGSVEKLEKIKLENILLKNLSPGCTAAFKRKIIEEYLKDYQSILEHDWFMNIISANLEGLYYYSKELTFYRIHENNTIGLSNKKNPFSRLVQMYQYWDKYVEDQYKRINFLTKRMYLKSEYFKELKEFVDIRYENLKRKSFSLWIKETRLYKGDLKEIVDARGIVIDLCKIILRT